MRPVETHRFDETFVVLKPDLSVDTIALSPALYERLNADYGEFRGHTLVSVHEFCESWGSWERHPAGDEVVLLLSGAVRFRIRTEQDEVLVELASPGAYVVIPRGQWHTAETQQSAKLLFITPGEGTEHKQES